MRGLLQGRNWLGNAELPHPPIMDGVFRVIENAIREAWCQVCDSIDSIEINSKQVYEDQVTEVLWKKLNDLRLQEPLPIAGFSEDQFESVLREGNWRDCQNSSIDKQPDLVFKFHGKRFGVSSGSHAYDGLFVECKPIDGQHPVKKHYLENGLSRFADGTYAWAMQDAMMLGYAIKGFTIDKKLLPMLSGPSQQALLKMSSPPAPCHGEKEISDCCETQHDRDCVYQHSGVRAGLIKVRHLWLEN